MFVNSYCYFQLSYTSASQYLNVFTLSIWLLFISLMQPVNGAQFLNIATLFFSSKRFAASSAPAPSIVTVSLWSTYASLYSHKLHFYIEVLNLIWLIVLHVLRAPSFISTQLFVLNLVGWFGVLSKKFIIFWYSIIIPF